MREKISTGFTKKLWILGLLLLLVDNAMAQVTVSLLIKPPYSSHISDYKHLENKAVITLVNTSGASLTVKLGGSLTNQSAGLTIRTQPDYRPSSPVTIGPHGVVTLVANANAMRFLDDGNVTTNVSTKMKEDIIRTGLLPEGMYQLCVDVYDYNTNALLSTPGTGCFTFNISLAQPPVVTYPANGQEIAAEQSALNFSWSPVVGNTAGGVVVYDLVVAEVQQGQNPNDAVGMARDYKAGNPPIYKQNIPSQIYVRQPSDLPFTAGHTYAVQVVARDANKKLSFLNDGKSEIVVFTIRKEEEHKKTIDDGSGPGKKITYSKGGFTPKTGRMEDLEKYAFKGKLVWGFLKSEDKKSILTGTAVNTSTTFTGKDFGQMAEGAKKYEGLGGLPGSGNNGGNNTGGNKFTQSTDVLSSGSYNGKYFGSGNVNYSKYTGGNNNSAQMVSDPVQDAIDQLVSDKKYPLAFTKLTIFKVIDPNFAAAEQKQKNLNPFGNSGGSGTSLPAEMQIGTTTTDANGNYSFDYYGTLELGYYIQIRVDRTHFDFTDIAVPIQTKSYGIYDMGEITGLANTYRLKINVKDETGKAVTNAQVKILRVPGYYTNPKEHTNLVNEILHSVTSGTEDARGSGYQKGGAKPKITPYEVAGAGAPGDKFYKVFYNADYSDRYIVSIKGEGFDDFTDDLAVDGNGYEAQNDYVLDMEENYTLKLSDPAVKGRVVDKQGAIAISKATVIVHPASMDYLSALQSNQAYAAATDDSGKFKIDHIPVSKDPYRITVVYQGKAIDIPKDIFLLSKGVVENFDPLQVDIALLIVCGNVVDEHNKTINNAALHWKTGGQVFYSNAWGNFTSAQTIGKHILVAQKPGYRDQELTIDVEPPVASTYSGTIHGDKEGEKVFTGTYNKNGLPGMMGGGDNKKTESKTIGSGFSGTYTNYENGTSEASAAFKDATNTGSYFAPNGSCGHTIVMKAYFLKVVVKDDATSAAIADAHVSIEDNSLPVATNANGVAIVEGVPVGESKLIVKGPVNSFYTTTLCNTFVDGKKDTAVIQITLKAGAKATGTVTDGKNPVNNAEVYVVGKEYITTTTDKNGKYTLVGIPVGEYSIRATKSGLVGDTKSNTFAANQQATIDFVLKDPGFDATELLGFTLTLDDVKQGTNPNEFIISGSLSKIPSNNVFTVTNASALKIPFTSRTVIKTGKTIVPKDNEMALDVSEIPVTFFDNYKGSLKGSPLRLRGKDGYTTKGEIVGEVAFDLHGSYATLSDWQMPTGTIKLSTNNSTKIGAISSDGTAPANSFALSSSSNVDWSVYGVDFTPDLAGSKIESSGLYLKGKLSLSNIPGLSSAEITVDPIKIGANGEVKSVAISLSPQPVITIGTNWKLKITGATIDQFGLSLGGNMDVPVPNSATASIGMSNLVVSKSGISGGSLYLPDAGMDVFGVTNFKSADPLSMQSVPGGNDFKITGGGTFHLPQYIADDITLSNFSIATNGDFSASAQTGLSCDFGGGLANISVYEIKIANSEFNLGSTFSLNIPDLGITSNAHIHYTKGNVKLDQLYTHFDIMDDLKLSLYLDFLDNGFSGKGDLSLMGTSGIALQFHYNNLGNGIDVGAQFNAPAEFVVPITVATWDQITGGFNFNTSDNVYSVNAGGRISLADLGSLLALTDVNIKITASSSGPMLEGSANATVLDNWNIGNAYAKIDFGNALFYCTGSFGAGFNLIKGLSCDGSSSVTVSASAGSDKYIFAAGSTTMGIPYVFNSSAYIAGGWNAPKSVDPSLSAIPDVALYNGRVYGGFFGAHSSIGLTKDQAPKLGFGSIAYVTAWFNNESDITVYGNLKSNAYGFSYAQNWSAGAEADFIGLSVAGADISLSGALNATYNGSWNIAGTIAGGLGAHVGCDGGCNGITWGCCFNPCWPWHHCTVCPCPCGAKICGNASVTIGYTSGSGFSFSPSFF